MIGDRKNILKAEQMELLIVVRSLQTEPKILNPWYTVNKTKKCSNQEQD